MNLRFSPYVEKFREEVRDYIRAEWHPDPKWSFDSVEMIEYEKVFRRKLAQKGWYAAALPKEYGGSAFSLDYQYVLSQEMAYYDIPPPTHGVGIVSPTLLRVGTEEQKARFIPRIVSGEIDFCLGYTEPGAGSDLASLQVRAVRDGDDYVITGQKVFTTKAHRADYVWLATRTDPNVPKHKGISLFIVDIHSPGIVVKPIITMPGIRTNAVYYDDVRVPKENLVGEENKGWYYMATALDFERVSVTPISPHRRGLENLIKYASENTQNGKPLKDDPDVRDKIARLSADIEMAQLISLRVLTMMSKGIVPNYEASMLKMFATEARQRLNYWGTQIMGHYGTLPPGAKYAPFEGEIEKEHRGSVIGTVAAGSSEIQRNIIAQRGLGLPR